MSEAMSFDKDAYLRDGRAQHVWSIVALEGEDGVNAPTDFRRNKVDWRYMRKKAEENMHRSEANFILAKEWLRLVQEKSS